MSCRASRQHTSCRLSTPGFTRLPATPSTYVTARSLTTKGRHSIASISRSSSCIFFLLHTLFPFYMTLSRSRTFLLRYLYVYLQPVPFPHPVSPRCLYVNIFSRRRDLPMTRSPRRFAIARYLPTSSSGVSNTPKFGDQNRSAICRKPQNLRAASLFPGRPRLHQKLPPQNNQPQVCLPRPGSTKSHDVVIVADSVIQFKDAVEPRSRGSKRRARSRMARPGRAWQGQVTNSSHPTAPHVGFRQILYSRVRPIGLGLAKRLHDSCS